MSCSGSLVPNQCRGSAALINVDAERGGAGLWTKGKVSSTKNRKACKLTIPMPYLALHLRGDKF